MRRSLALPALLSLLCPVSLLHAGELKTHELESKFIHDTVKLNVLLPDGYGEGDTRYPVVYLLHGIGGDYSEWERVGIVEQAAGLPVIIAMPEGHKSFYINVHDNPDKRWEDYFIQEVIPFVEETYRTHGERAGRGISGLSMGGYAAFVLGMRHPDLFSSVASHSGAFGVLELDDEGLGERVHEVFGPEESETREEYHIYHVIEQRVDDGRLPHLYLDCGSQDFVLEWNRDLVAEMSEMDVAYEYRELPGEHNFEYWRAHVRYSLERQLEAFADPTEPRQPERREERDPIAGVWDLVAITPEDEEVEIVVTLERDGEEVSGLFESERGEREIEEGSFEDDALRIKVPFRDGAWVVLEGKIEDGSLVGEWTIQDKNETVFLRGEWEAARRGSPEAEEGSDEDDSIAGVWDVVASVPGDDPHEAVWFIEHDDDGFAGRAEVEDESVEFSEVAWEDERLEIAFPFGEDGTIFVAGRLVDDRLVGEWRLEDNAGDVRAEGEWRGERRAPKKVARQESKEEPSGGVVGIWLLEATLPDGERHDARLFIEQRGNRYTGRSESERGNAKFEKVSYEDGKLVIEIEMRDGEAVIVLKGELDGDHLEGRWTFQDDVGVEVASGTWVAERESPPEKKPVAVVEIAGAWDVVAVLPDGTERASQTLFERDGEGYNGRSVSDDGEVEYEEVSYAEGVLKFEFKFDIEGESVRVRVRAELDDGKFVGLWTLFSLDGDSLASGEWEAKRGKSRRF